MENNENTPNENSLSKGNNNKQEEKPIVSELQQEKQGGQLAFENRLDLRELQQNVQKIKEELGKVIVGQKDMIEMLIASLLAKGHSLIEGVPGVAKTVAAKLMAKSLDIGFSRIQFTPDLMPSDILGTSVFDIKKSEFEFKKGPVFSNMILIDEINRAPAKTQAALFEVMEEQQITIDGIAYKLDTPFMVLATQNPIEQEGTYRLPEAQLDRFLFKINVLYPNLEEEIEIINREHLLKGKDKITTVKPLLSAKQITNYQNLVSEVLIEENLLKYIAQLIVATRSNQFLYLGASPRASISILKASKAIAAMNGRDFVTPEDIKRVAVPVLHHRVIVTPEREMEGISSKDIINQIIETLEVPR